MADLALHLAVLHGQVEPTWLVGVLAGVGGDDAGPLGLTKMETVSWQFTGMRIRNLGTTYGLLEEDIFCGVGVMVVFGAGVVVVGAGGCFRGDFGVWAGDRGGGAAATGAGLGASAGPVGLGESFALSDTFKVSVDAGPFSYGGGGGLATLGDGLGLLRSSSALSSSSCER